MQGADGKTLEAHFLGTGWAFPPAFDSRTRGALMVAQLDDVQESLRILLSTTPGERVMRPTYGCDLRRLVFEPLTLSTLTEMRSTIEQAVLFFEVRITLESVEFDLEEAQAGVLRIRLEYTVRTTNSRHNMVFPLYLEEGSVGPGIEP
ncbi:MAG: GPW/gp25 family protein [Rubrivivax sp.]|nr:GPW/gp25 family protein [Rubrivivax sp.]